MDIKTQEVQSALDKAVTKDDVLRLIVRALIRPLFKRPQLDIGQEWALVLGAIGDRGGGKSGSTACIALTDHIMSGKTCYSNMDIACDIEVDDETAREFGLNSGGVVHYESLPLDKNALLALDERYHKACILIEEINVQYSNVRRFMSNTNVDFNEVCQQLRKLETSLLFNVIDEMFIDPQLRALSDIFIKTYDTAFDISSFSTKKPRGVDFMWKIYPMSGYLCGEQNKYAVTHRAVDNVCFHFAVWQGIYDSMRHQEKGIYSMSTKDKNKLNASVSVESSEEMTSEVNEWEWLETAIINLRNAGVKELRSTELQQYLGLAERGLSISQVAYKLGSFGVRRSAHKSVYYLDAYRVEEKSLSLPVSN
jgi:hypothetical protein